MNPLATLAHTAWLAASAPAYLRLRRAFAAPQTAQAGVLRTILARNAGSDYGREHGFATITNYAEYVRRVPVVDYDVLSPWIERVRHGAQNVLTRERVTHLMPTSGTTSGRKLIPFTAGLQRDFNAAIGPWVMDLASRHPGIVAGRGYWSVTPLENPNNERAAVPIGFEDDSHYLGGARARLIAQIMAVPSAVRHIGSQAAFRHVVLLHLLRQRDLRLVSVWHPSFLRLLLDDLCTHWEALVNDLAQGTCLHADSLPPALRHRLRLAPALPRARELAAADPRRPATIWPQLRLVSCWADGHASGPAADLARRLPGVHLQPKGLLATEAFVTVPFAGTHSLALNSHFFEFVDDHGDFHRADEVCVGESYRVIVTTSGGLYRYDLGDRVLVTRLLERTPCLQFVGRPHASDLCGEKLTETFVARALAGLGLRQRFALLAPARDGEVWRYTLYAEGNLSTDLAGHLDAALAENPHYALCRRLGQIAAAGVFEIEDDGYSKFVAAETARGVRWGDLKPVALSTRTDWSQHFRRAGPRPVATAAPTLVTDKLALG